MDAGAQDRWSQQWRRRRRWRRRQAQRRPRGCRLDPALAPSLTLPTTPSRHAEGTSQGPKLTPEQLRGWLRRQGAETAESLAAAAAARQQAIREGRVPLEQLTGRELHEHHPEVFDGF